MKLFTRYSRTNILVIVVIFLIASAALYLSLRYVLLYQVDEALRIEEGEVKAYVAQNHRAPQSITVKEQLTDILPAAGPTPRHYTIGRFVEPGEQEPENFRQLVFGLQVNDRWYQVTVSKSLEDTNHLILSVLTVSLGTVLAILVATFFINRVLLRRLWRDFYHSLAAVRDFHVGAGKPLRLPSSEIDEFSFMNGSLERLTKQASTDYQVLKTFSENASHELQTPIAIIRSKLDLLIQEEGLSETQSQIVLGAYSAAQRLAQLNQSLLLLARIGNFQYEEISAIRMDEALKEKLSDFQELWQAQQIRIQPQLQPLTVRMNIELAHILLNNLLSNATRHNRAGGVITIVLDTDSLEVGNTSQEPALDDRVLFRRFYKRRQNTQHNGLGLSIVKQICDVSGFPVSYRYDAGRHCFRISFAPGDHRE